MTAPALAFSPTSFRVDAVRPEYWRVTFNWPPVNVIGPDMIRDLKSLLTQLETDTTVKVVVFDSADPDFFLAHYDLAADPSIAESLPSPTGYAAWVDILVRLTHLPAVTISAIRGYTRGAGSEFVLATDIRFASLEKAVLSQWEVVFTALPGGGAAGRLPSLVGRGRTFEILLGGDDFDAATAEKYGYVNRALPDADLDAHVSTFADRVARWDRRVIADIKEFVNRYTLLPDAEFPPHSDKFWEAVARPEFKSAAAQLFERGLQQREPVEYDLGREIATLTPTHAA